MLRFYRALFAYIAMTPLVGVLLTHCAPPSHRATTHTAPAAGKPDTAHTLLQTTDFSDGIMLPWMTSFTPPARGDAEIRDGAMCLRVEEKGARRWDAQLRHRGMVIRNGHVYHLGLKVWSSRDTKLTMKLGMSGPPYTDYATELIKVTPEPQVLEFGFQMTEPDDATAELAFHAGGQMVTGSEPVEVCFDDVVLSDPLHTPVPRDAPPDPPPLRVNQLGFYPGLQKLAVLVSDATTAQRWQLLNAGGQSVASGETLVSGPDATSGDNVHLIDFSEWTAPGVSYRMQVGDATSDPFMIDATLYKSLARDALRFFYHMRSGIAVEMPYAEKPEWCHPPGHQPDVARCAPDTDCQYSLDVTGGWYDAGDQGKYVVNGGFSTWLLHNAVERAQVLGGSTKLLADGALHIPESGNGVMDVLDEARWELEFLLKMQIPPGKPLAGMAHHKMHDADWTALATAPHEDQQPRVLRPPSTAATLNLAAAAAQGARLWLGRDPDFAQRCLAAAESAWNAARKHPHRLAPPSDQLGGGPYDDDFVEDEFYWAAAELYLSTGKAAYQDYLQHSKLDEGLASEFVIDGQAAASAATWQRVDLVGKMSLALAPPPSPTRPSYVSKKTSERYREQLIRSAELLLVTLAHQGYRFPMRPDAGNNYHWGSNADVLGNILILGAAADWVTHERFTNGAVAGMDYLLGRNALGKSYVSGYGARPLENPHHRFWAFQANPAYPKPPPGVASGGPNSDMQDPYIRAAGLKGCPQQKCYVDHIEAYSVNEVAINWNAALGWAAIWLEDRAK
jgi:endoglucanase